MTRKVVNFPPEWVAGFTRNQWQLCSGMGGRFGPESAWINKQDFHYCFPDVIKVRANSSLLPQEAR
ncbi:MAG: hypothetical protein Q7J67_06785 [bacterium]|nr:hypothetical protein [bacterium]